MRPDHVTPRLLASACLLPLLPCLTNAQGGDPPAQWPDPPEQYRVDNVLELDELGLSATVDVQRVGWGDFQRDQTGTAIVLADGALHFAVLPYFLKSLAPVEAGASGVEDFTVVEDVSGGHDLLSVDGRGLVHHPADSATGTFLAPVVLEGAAWIGSTRLTSSRLPGATSTLVAGLAADGKTLLLGRFSSGTWTAFAPVTAPLDVIDFAVFDDLDDGSGDLALLLPVGLFFYDLNGNFIDRWTSNSTVGGLATVVSEDAATSTTHSMVAWWYENTSTGKYELTAADSTTLQTSIEVRASLAPNLAPQDLDPVTIAAGDVDLDGHEDVILSTTVHAAVLFENGFGSNPNQLFSNASADYEVFATDLNPAGSTTGTAEICLAAFDFEGPKDPILVHQELTEVQLFKRIEATVNGVTTSFGTQSDELLDDYTSYTWDATSGETGTFNMALNIPPLWYDSPNFTFTHLQVLTFHQTQAQAPMTSAAVSNRVSPLHTDPSSAHQVFSPLFRPDPLNASALLDIDGEYWDNPQHHFWVLFRFVELVDPQAPTLHVSNSSQFFFTSMTLQTADLPVADGDVSYAGFLAGIPGASAATQIEVNPLDGDPGGNTYSGAFVPQTQSPIFPPGDPPVPGSIVLDPIPTTTFNPNS